MISLLRNEYISSSEQYTIDQNITYFTFILLPVYFVLILYEIKCSIISIQNFPAKHIFSNEIIQVKIEFIKYVFNNNCYIIYWKPLELHGISCQSRHLCSYLIALASS